MARAVITTLLASILLAFAAANQGEAEFEGATEFVIESVDDKDDYGEVDEEEKINVVPFSDEWRAIYTEEHLSRQPTWYTEDQPESADYIVREYPAAWWATSYTPCLNHSVAVGYGYLKLYLYFQKYNYQRIGYPLTYPILTKIEVDSDDEPDSKERERCTEKFSQNFYLPIDLDDYPAASPDDSIRAEIVPTRKYYVKRFGRNDIDDFQPVVCNAHAGVLIASLALDGIKFNPNSWYCAQYEPGKSGLNGIFEVWIESTE